LPEKQAKGSKTIGKNCSKDQNHIKKEKQTTQTDKKNQTNPAGYPKN